MLRKPVTNPPSPAARVINGQVCGTAIHIYRDQQRSLWLTNAHVAGTRKGHTVRLEIDLHLRLRVNATLIAAAYRRGFDADWAVLETPPQPLPVCPIVVDDDPEANDVMQSAGSGRCEQTYHRYRYYENWVRDVVYSNPNAIGGESGSGVLEATGRAVVGLLTWSASGKCVHQRSSAIASMMLGEAAWENATPIPMDFMPATPQIAQCSDTIFQPTAWPDAMFVTSDELHAAPDDDNDKPFVEEFDWGQLIDLLTAILEFLRSRTEPPTG